MTVSPGRPGGHPDGLVPLPHSTTVEAGPGTSKVLEIRDLIILERVQQRAQARALDAAGLEPGTERGHGLLVLGRALDEHVAVSPRHIARCDINPSLQKRDGLVHRLEAFGVQQGH